MKFSICCTMILPPSETALSQLSRILWRSNGNDCLACECAQLWNFCTVSKSLDKLHPLLSCQFLNFLAVTLPPIPGWNSPRSFNKSFSFLAWQKKWTKTCQTKTINITKMVKKLTFSYSFFYKGASIIILTSVMKVVFTWILMMNHPWTSINIVIDYA